MQDFEIGLRYLGGIPDGYLDEFRESFVDGDVRLYEQEFEPRPANTIEWVIPTAIAVYLAKPFLDAIIKRAADDFGDTVYPRIKAAVVNLVKKLYIRERLPLVVMTSQGPKDRSADTVLFSVYSETTTMHRIKFVFTKTYTEENYVACVDQIFGILAEHHASPDGSDALSRQIAKLPVNRQDQIYLVYDEESATWNVHDPIQEASDRKRKSNRTS